MFLRKSTVRPPKTNDELSYNSEKDYETIATNTSKQLTPQQSSSNNDPGYETVMSARQTGLMPPGTTASAKKSSDYDPNYEVLKTPKSGHELTSAAALSDDGYAKVLEKHRVTLEEDANDGYSKVRGDNEDNASAGYSTIGELKSHTLGSDANHNYASILETKAAAATAAAMLADAGNDTDSDHYARIADTKLPPQQTQHAQLQLNAVTAPLLQQMLSETNGKSKNTELPLTPASQCNSSTISPSNANSNTASTLSSAGLTPSSQYESLTGSDTDPNYESVCYLSSTATTMTTTTTTKSTNSAENPYERLQTADDNSDDTQQLGSPLSEQNSSSGSATETASVQQGTTATSEQRQQLKSNGTKTVLRQPVTGAAEVNEGLVVDDYFQV